MIPSDDDARWHDLVQQAQQVVRETLHALPGSLRGLATKLPIFYEEVPDDAAEQDGVEFDTLGLFSGATLEEGQQGEAIVSGQITLYLKNIWEFATADSVRFQEEVRVTLLHELGHYLGLGEEELESRGLE